MRIIGIICVSALLLALAIPAYAETQNVRVSGDLTIRGIYRDQFDLNKNDNEPDSDNFAMSTAEIQVDADLTDNVSTVIRLVNQRNWGDSEYPTQRIDASGYYQRYEISWPNRLLDVGIDLAYVKIKEMIFEPVTLTIGRQDIWFGRGFIIGLNQRDPGYIGPVTIAGNVFLPRDNDLRGTGSPELTAYNAFDAVRATIDFEQYAPFVVDLVYAKVDEGKIGPEDDRDLYGVNAGYTFDVYNAEAEAYYWLKHDNSDHNAFIGDADQVHVVGTRGSFQPNSDWEFGAEVAYQFGHYIGSSTQQAERDRSAWALDLYADYLGWLDYTWSPKIGAEYIYWSGEDNVGSGGGQYQGWDPMFIGYFPTVIRPFQGVYYMNDTHPDGADMALSNQHQVLVSGSIKPLDDVTFEAVGAYYWFDDQPDTRFYGIANKEEGEIGGEINLTTTYDYTEDVTFSLFTGWFFPGEHYEGQEGQPGSVESGTDVNPQVATEIIGTMKVSF